MPQRPEGASGASLPAPSMLDLVRLSPRLLFPPGGVDLYRQIALLTDLAKGEEVIDVACGKGVPLEYFVREHEAIGSGVDADPHLIEIAEARSKKDGIAARLQFQTRCPTVTGSSM
jgi:2-polyprenyl-3-methyl-5-hydroxy-6-metoxy-1,4-benzoquinol methylase